MNANQKVVAEFCRQYASGLIGLGELVDICRNYCIEPVTIDIERRRLQAIPADVDPATFPPHTFIDY